MAEPSTNATWAEINIFGNQVPFPPAITDFIQSDEWLRKEILTRLRDTRFSPAEALNNRFRCLRFVINTVRNTPDAQSDSHKLDLLDELDALNSTSQKSPRDQPKNS